MKKFVLVGISVLVMGMLVLTSCTPAAPTAPTTPTESMQSGTIRIGYPTFHGETINPETATANDKYRIHGGMLDFYFNYSNEGLEPGVVESFALAADGQSWTFNIRQGIKFHNGEDLMADDVKYSLDLVAGESFHMSEQITAQIESIDVVDDYTLRINTKGQRPFLTGILSNTTPGFPVYPKDYLESVGFEGYDENPIGSGPWKFVNHVSGDQYEFEAVDSHWRGTPEFKTMQLLLVPEETTAIAMMRTDSLDAFSVSLDNVPDVESYGASIHQMDSRMVQAFMLATQDPRAAADNSPLVDVNVRKALSLLLDRDLINEGLFNGQLGPVMPPGILAGMGDINAKTYQDYAATLHYYNLDEAKKLLTDAGYGGGFNVDFYVAPRVQEPYLLKVAETMQGMWLEAGVNAELNVMDWGALKPRVQGGDMPPEDELVGTIFLTSRGWWPTATQGGYAIYHSVLRSYFLLSKSWPQYDELSDAIDSELDPAKRTEMIDELYKMVTPLYVSIPVGQGPSLFAVASHIDVSVPPQTQFTQVAAFAKHK
ncbi:ABC transporter substrate-binding protein [Chloroflexota bacterium]